MAVAQRATTAETPTPMSRNQELGIRVDHVAKTFVTHGLWPITRRNQVLVDASLEVPKGEVVAIVGANGSGKSTLMKIIAGALEPDAGRVALSSRYGYCPQTPVVYPKLTVDETFRLFGVAYEMTESGVEQRKAELFAALSFETYHDYRVEHLSGGTQQKLNLAVALLHDPEVLLLDEPYAGFDYETYIRFWDLSEELAGKGHSVLIVSHFVERQERFNRIYRVEGGRCVRER